MSPEMLLTAEVALVVLAFTTLLRAEMLRKSLDPRPDEPRPTYSGNWFMIVGMDVVAGTAAGAAWELFRNGVPGWLCSGFAVACAATSVIILGSMILHNLREATRRKAGETRRADILDLKTAAEEIIPPVVERSLEQVTTGFMQPAPDHDRLIRIDPLPPSAPPAD